MSEASNLTERARSSTKQQFAVENRGYYLVMAERAERMGIGFETMVMPANRKSTAPTPQTYEIIPVQKAPGNPYPDRISVGRARNCDVVLRDPSVSKLHAHFRRRDDEKLELVDLGSQNGTRINSRLLVPHQPESVGPSDQLVFGGVNAKLVDAEQLFDLLQAK